MEVLNNIIIYSNVKWFTTFTSSNDFINYYCGEIKWEVSMQDINKVCDYVIFRLKSEDEYTCTNLKLQKLLYYIQAWHLALKSEPLFRGKFQAWIHGPVSREIYNRFKDTKSLYSEIVISDIKGDDFNNLEEEIKKHIDTVLETYAGFTSYELEKMTHDEEPWITARNGYQPTQRCEVEIDEQIMERYYKARLN